MAKTLYQNIEEIAKERQVNPVYLKSLLRTSGIPVLVSKPVQSTHTTVYGRTAGEAQSEKTEIIVLATGDDFFGSDGISFGTFIEGFLFTDSTLLNVGDTVEVVRPNPQLRKYKVESIETLGTTNNVFKRYKIAAIG